MKIKQLLEAFEQQRGEFPDTSTGGVLGSGAFASVKGDKDPFMVNKSAYGEDEAYSIYIKFLADNKLAQANPHFPRVYEIGDNKWKMEKLPFTLKQFFEDDENQHYKQMICDVYLKQPKNDAYWNFTNPKLIKLGTYRRALEMVNAYADNHNSNREPEDKYLGHDLHSKNIMVRLTPQGPQLVITDPWY